MCSPSSILIRTPRPSRPVPVESVTSDMHEPLTPLTCCGAERAARVARAEVRELRIARGVRPVSDAAQLPVVLPTFLLPLGWGTAVPGAADRVAGTADIRAVDADVRGGSMERHRCHHRPSGSENDYRATLDGRPMQVHDVPARPGSPTTASSAPGWRSARPGEPPRSSRCPCTSGTTTTDRSSWAGWTRSGRANSS